MRGRVFCARSDSRFRIAAFAQIRISGKRSSIGDHVMSHTVSSRAAFSLGRRFYVLVALVILLVAAGVTYTRWWPVLQRLVAAAVNPPQEEKEDDHAGHAHADPNAIEISPQARESIGLTTGKVALGPYDRKISIPGVVVERSGRTARHVTAPLTGVVTKIEASRGEAITPGQPLFELRLTDEDLVAAQGNLLLTVEELDVIGREIERLEEATKGGAVARKELLDRQYEQQKKQATLRAQKEALVLHGLSQEQVDEIVSGRTLLRTFALPAPMVKRDDKTEDVVFQLQELNVTPGQSVNVGETLAVLADPSELLIEGDAFERDIAQISHAAEKGWKVSAVVPDEKGETEVLSELSMLFVDGKVDSATRTFHFYVVLPNRVVRDVKQEGVARYVDWRFKVGQRMQVRVPVEVWEKRIVLPVAAVAQDGVENYVFQENGKNFVRRPVHVEHRDELEVVIANDGGVFPSDTIAMNGAQQLLIALKNKSGPAVDPHAGHNH